MCAEHGRSFRMHAAAALALLFCAVPAAQAQEVGQIKRLDGEVRVVRDGKPLPAEAGMVLRAGDRVITGAKGAMGFTTTDNSRISLGPNSYLVVDQYAFDQRTQDGSIAMRFLKGTFAVITGLVGRRSPQSVRYATPTTTIGIRGTEFAVAVELPPELEAQILAR